jgi:hypothetical protein
VGVGARGVLLILWLHGAGAARMRLERDGQPSPSRGEKNVYALASVLIMSGDEVLLVMAGDPG